MTKKSSAADRTANMFGEAPNMDNREIETIEGEPRGERVPVEQDVDRMRANVFKAQEWTSKFFPGPGPGAPGNAYRMTFKDDHYYLETVLREEGKPAYGYSGLMVHRGDLLNLATVIVQAAREEQKRGT